MSNSNSCDEIATNSLALEVSHPDDHGAELRASLTFDGFSGHGRCYVELKRLKTEAALFGEYPLKLTGGPCVAGGYFTDDLRALKETLLLISARPSGVTGGIALIIELATPSDIGPSEFSAKVSCSIPIDYEQMKSLSEGLAGLAQGDLKLFQLEL